jgi:hypothetical protein
LVAERIGERKQKWNPKYHYWPCIWLSRKRKTNSTIANFEFNSASKKFNSSQVPQNGKSETPNSNYFSFANRSFSHLNIPINIEFSNFVYNRTFLLNINVRVLLLTKYVPTIISSHRWNVVYKIKMTNFLVLF